MISFIVVPTGFTAIFSITDDNGVNIVLHNPILPVNQSNGNQLVLPEPTPGPGQDTPHEERELCVRDTRNLSTTTPGLLANLLSLVPANHNSMQLRQQRDMDNAVNNVLVFLGSVERAVSQYLRQPGGLDLVQRTDSGVIAVSQLMEIMRHFLQSNNILKFKRNLQSQGSQVISPTDLEQGILGAAFSGFTVRISEQMHRQLRESIVSMGTLVEGSGEGDNGLIQSVNSTTSPINIVAHQQLHEVQTIVRLGKVEVNVARQAQGFDGSFVYSSDEYIFDHEAFRSSLESGGAGQTNIAVVEELN